jgi:hypothetical protein
MRVKTTLEGLTMLWQQIPGRVCMALSGLHTYLKKPAGLVSSPAFLWDMSYLRKISLKARFLR